MVKRHASTENLFFNEKQICETLNQVGRNWASDAQLLSQIILGKSSEGGSWGETLFEIIGLGGGCGMEQMLIGTNVSWILYANAKSIEYRFSNFLVGVGREYMTSVKNLTSTFCRCMHHNNKYCWTYGLVEAGSSANCLSACSGASWTWPSRPLAGFSRIYPSAGFFIAIGPCFVSWPYALVELGVDVYVGSADWSLRDFCLRQRKNTKPAMNAKPTTVAATAIPATAPVPRPLFEFAIDVGNAAPVSPAAVAEDVRDIDVEVFGVVEADTELLAVLSLPLVLALAWVDEAASTVSKMDRVGVIRLPLATYGREEHAWFMVSTKLPMITLSAWLCRHLAQSLAFWV